MYSREPQPLSLVTAGLKEQLLSNALRRLVNMSTGECAFEKKIPQSFVTKCV